MENKKFKIITVNKVELSGKNYCFYTNKMI